MSPVWSHKRLTITHTYSWACYGLSDDESVKVRSHMRGADVAGGGRKIGFNTNHYMHSHMRGHRAGAEREQNPLCNKWVQHPIFTSTSKPHALNHLCPQEMADPPASAPRMCEHIRGGGAGMSESTRLCSATVPRVCERSYREKCHSDIQIPLWFLYARL